MKFLVFSFLSVSHFFHPAPQDSRGYMQAMSDYYASVPPAAPDAPMDFDGELDQGKKVVPTSKNATTASE